MSDEVDLANEHMEKELEALIAAARGIERPLKQHTTHCPDCGIKLKAHRLPYGYCVPCGELREARRRWR